MNKPANYLLLTQCEVAKENIPSLVARWQKNYSSSSDRSLYVNEDTGALFEFVALPSVSNIENELKCDKRKALEAVAKSVMDSDWRRQVIELKEVVISSSRPVPVTPYLQLRHIEVPLSRYADYLQWRKHTIFEYVKKQSFIESFLAYHSFLSSTPGVLFLSGFSCCIEDYLAVFSHPDFQKIAKEAAEKYIYLGPKGLATKVYKKVG